MCTDTNKNFDPTKPVQTRDGRKVRIVDTNYKGNARRPILAIITEDDHTEICHTFNKDGSSLPDMTRDLDLINIPEKYTLWVNLYADRGILFTHSSRAQADVNAGASRIACVKVEFEEGEGL